MPLTGDYAPIEADWVRKQVEEIERTGTTAEVKMPGGKPIVLMICKGAKTGALRRTPVMRVEHDGAYAVVASKGGAPENPGWYRNLVKEPLAELQDGTDRADYHARIVSGDERAQWWDRAVAVWPDYAEYQKKTDREIPVFVFERA